MSASLEAGPVLPPEGMFDQDIVLDSHDEDVLFSDTGGTTPQTTAGQQIKSITNQGAAGGVSSSAGFTSTLGPTLAVVNGMTVMDFRSGDRFLGKDVTSGATGSLTFTIVFRAVLDNSWDNGQFLASLIGSSNGTIGFHLYAASQEWGLTMGSGTENWGLGGNPAPCIDDGWHVLTGRRTAGVAGAGTWDIWVDGIKVDTASVGAAETIARFNLGGPFNGLIAHASFDRTTARTDQFIIDSHTYLMDRFADLIIPEGEVRNAVIFIGDSTETMQTCTSGGTWTPLSHNCGIVARALRTSSNVDVAYSNAWVGKRTSQNRTATELTRLAAWANRATGKKLFIIKSGVNDLWSEGLTPAQVYAQITGLISDLRALVPDAIFLVEHPNSGDPGVWGGSYPDNREDVCDLIDDTGSATTNGYTIGTVRSDPVGLDWGNPSRTSSLFSADGLHELASGQERSGAVMVTDAAALLAA